MAKRMRPNEYKLEAATVVINLRNRLLPRLGKWNMDKVLDEIERLLREERRAR